MGDEFLRPDGHVSQLHAWRDAMRRARLHALRTGHRVKVSALRQDGKVVGWQWQDTPAPSRRELLDAVAQRHQDLRHFGWPAPLHHHEAWQVRDDGAGPYCAACGHAAQAVAP